MDGHHRLVTTEQCSYLICQISQRITVLCKNNQLFSLAICAEHFLFILQQTGKFFPFAVLSAHAHLIGHFFQSF